MLHGRLFKLLIFIFLLIVALPATPAQVTLLDLNGAVGPATKDYVVRGIDKAVTENSQAVILVLDTPGGLDKSMRAIVSKIISSPIPIITYVAPSGARAASAGTYILYASHVAAMAPGTNVGAATPISLVGSEKNTPLTTEDKKAINDANAYLRSLAELRHRNVAWAELAVTQSVSISAAEALKLKVIDFIAPDINNLMNALHGKSFIVQNHQVTLNTSNLIIKPFAPDWRTRFLSIITDPNIAYILLIFGIYGLLFEFLNPGFILPGVAGLISLFIALYAFQLLPINYVGLALILLGIAFIVAEVFVTSFGALGIGGIIAFIIGSIMLFDTHVPGFTLLLPVLIAVVLVTIALLILLVQLALRAQRRPIVSGREEMLGSTGEVIIIKGDEERPRARIRGELWQIRSNVPLQQGQLIKVVGIDELILIVVPVNGSEGKIETKEGITS